MKLDTDTTHAALPALSAEGLDVAIVSARFNARIVDLLRRGAESAWARLGGELGVLSHHEVPGAY